MSVIFKELVEKIFSAGTLTNNAGILLCPVQPGDQVEWWDEDIFPSISQILSDKTDHLSSSFIRTGQRRNNIREMYFNSSRHYSTAAGLGGGGESGEKKKTSSHLVRWPNGPIIGEMRWEGLSLCMTRPARRLYRGPGSPGILNIQTKNYPENFTHSLRDLSWMLPDLFLSNFPVEVVP